MESEPSHGHYCRSMRCQTHEKHQSFDQPKHLPTTYPKRSENNTPNCHWISYLVLDKHKFDDRQTLVLHVHKVCLWGIWWGEVVIQSGAPNLCQNVDKLGKTLMLNPSVCIGWKSEVPRSRRCNGECHIIFSHSHNTHTSSWASNTQWSRQAFGDPNAVACDINGCTHRLLHRLDFHPHVLHTQSKNSFLFFSYKLLHCRCNQVARKLETCGNNQLEAGMPYSLIHVHWTPVLECCVVRCGSKDGHQKCLSLKDIGLHA